MLKHPGSFQIHEQQSAQHDFGASVDSSIRSALHKVALDGQDALKYLSRERPQLQHLLELVRQDQGRIFAFFPVLNNLMTMLESDDETNEHLENIHYAQALQLNSATLNLDWSGLLATSLTTVVDSLALILSEVNLTLRPDAQRTSQSALTDTDFLLSDTLTPLVGLWASGYAAASTWAELVTDSGSLRQTNTAPDGFDEWMLKASSNRLIPYFVKAGRSKDPGIANSKQLSGRLGTALAFLSVVEALPAWFVAPQAFDSLQYFRSHAKEIRGYTFATKIVKGDQLALLLAGNALKVAWNIGRADIVSAGSGQVVSDGLIEGYYLAMFQAAMTAVDGKALGTHYGGKGGKEVRKRLQHVANMVTIFEPLDLVSGDPSSYWAQSRDYPELQDRDRLDIMQALAYISDPGNPRVPTISISDSTYLEGYLRELLGLSELDSMEWEQTRSWLLEETYRELVSVYDSRIASQAHTFLLNEVLYSVFWLQNTSPDEWPLFYQQRIIEASRWNPNAFRDYFLYLGTKLPIARPKFAALDSLVKTPSILRVDSMDGMQQNKLRLDILQALAYTYAIKRYPTISQQEAAHADQWLRFQMGFGNEAPDFWLYQRNLLADTVLRNITANPDGTISAENRQFMLNGLLSSVYLLIMQGIMSLDDISERVKVIKSAARRASKYPATYFQQFYLRIGAVELPATSPETRTNSKRNVSQLTYAHSIAESIAAGNLARPARHKDE